MRRIAGIKQGQEIVRPPHGLVHGGEVELSGHMQEGAQMAGDFPSSPSPTMMTEKFLYPSLQTVSSASTRSSWFFRCAERDPTVMNTGSRFRGAGGISPKSAD